MDKAPAMFATPVLSLEESKKIIELAKKPLTAVRKKQLQEQAKLARQAFKNSLTFI